jgi:glycosyltransferase involved in cell wall biosynthesis
MRSTLEERPRTPADTRPLRILLIGSLPPPIGGTSVSFRQLVDELAEATGVAVEVVDTMRRGAAGPFSRASWAVRTALACLLAVRRADVVTFHASTPGTVWIAPALLLACRAFGRPFVLREFGGSLDDEYEEMSALARCLVRLAFRADRVLLQTHALVRFFRSQTPRAHLAWYSNSRPRASAAAAEPPGSAPGDGRFVFVGHVKETKGLRQILIAAEQLPGCHVDVYGPFHDGFSEREFAGSNRVRYRGELAPEEVVPTLRRYDAVLLPTWHFGEGYPGIVLEAYAAGRPVIASRWRAIPEIVEDGVSGLLVEPRDSDDLARAMRQLMADPEARRRLAEGARQAAERFASTRWTAEFAAVCRELARERRT